MTSSERPPKMASPYKIPMWIHMMFLCITVLMMIPPFAILRARYTKSPNPRVHPIPDMDNQKHYRKQGANVVFADGRSMRLPVAGTVARGELRADDHFYRGRVGGKWATTFPNDPNTGSPLLSGSTAERVRFLERGKQRYDIYCSPCHGYTGEGNGMVATRAKLVSEATWTDPTSLHKAGADGPAMQPVGQLFNTITLGVRNMPPYASQIAERDRWAIIAYMRALQRSQNSN